MNRTGNIRAVLFDFGGVIAEEGFRNGLQTIAGMNGLDQSRFFETARDLIAQTGYLTGRARETDYFGELRRLTGVRQSDGEMRRIILDGFVLREWMLDIVRRLSGHGIRTAILSDQTDWLDILDARYRFSVLFERVFNSFHTGKSKYDPSLFTDVLGWMSLRGDETVFVDDTEGHVGRARSRGLHALLYTDRKRFVDDLGAFFPCVVRPG